MKTTVKLLGLVILGAGLFISGCAKKQMTSFQSLKNPDVATQLKSFVVEKEAQTRAGTNEVSVYQAFFAAAEKGNWLAISNTYNDLKSHAPQYSPSQSANDERLNGPGWQVAKEIWGAFDAFGEGDEKYSTAFGNDIIGSIPAGSIYFGGTDPGRFLITALQKSQVKGEPFFTLTQNALVDGAYLDYLRSMYGGKIYIPTAEDSQKCFQDYTEDVQRRMQNHQLTPGEDVRTDASGKIQVSGQVAVMNINGLLAKTIFDKNPDREFYIEESFPLDWMYPYLEPHGLIMKINRQPLPALSEAVVSQDHDYWATYVKPMIGDWLKADTSVEEVAAFAEKVFAKKDFNGFTGDPRFIQNAYSQMMFSKLRSSQAGLYAWRAQHAADAPEKERMNEAADYAFRQAFALCPYSPEAVFRYVNLLLSEHRLADAITVAETAAQMPSMQGREGEQFRSLARQLQNYQKANQTSPDGK